MPAHRVVRQPPGQHGRTELDGVGAGDIPQGSILSEVPDQLLAAVSQVDDRPGLGVRPARFDVIGGEQAERHNRSLAAWLNETDLDEPLVERISDLRQPRRRGRVDGMAPDLGRY
jgi:hypothetical protein